MTFLVNFIYILCQVLTIIILARIILSWFSREPTNPLSSLLYQVTEPILAPLRRIIPRVGIFDFTPTVAVILLQGIAYLVVYLS